MAYELDPQFITEAVDYYATIIKGQPGKNTKGFPSDPKQLARVIQQAAFRAGKKPMLERYSAKLDAVLEKSAAPLKQNNVDPKRLDELTKQMELIDLQYEPIPEGASAIEAIRTYTKLMHESMMLAQIMGKGVPGGKVMNYAAAVASPEFKNFQSKLEKSIEEDTAKLKNDPVAKRYIADYPALADGLRVGFESMLGVAKIPIREALVYASILAEDPKVRSSAFDWATMISDPHEGWDKLMGTINESLTKATFSEDIKNRRLPIDIGLDLGASPALLERMGIPNFINKNLVWDSMSGIKTTALNMKDRMKGTFIEQGIDFFRNKWDVQSEKFGEALYKKIDTMFGPEIGADIKKQIQGNLTQLYANTQGRMAQAEKIYKGAQDGIRSVFAELTPDEQVAVVYMQQNANAQAPAASQAVMQSPQVVSAYNKVHTMLDDIKTVDVTPFQRSGYWPAYQKNVTKGWNLIDESQSRFWTKARRGNELVNASVDTINENIDALVQRIAYPYINAMKTSATENARVLAGVAFSTLEDYIKTPQRLSVIKDALQEAPIAKTGALTSQISRYMNAAYLQARFASWTLRDALNNTVNFATNVLYRAKTNMPISFSEMIGDSIAPADIVDNTMNGPLAGNEIRGIGVMSMFNKALDLPFSINRNIQNFTNDMMYKMNYGSELKGISRELGVPVEKLPQESLDKASRAAADMTRTFGMAYSFSSAFTQNFFSKLASPYLNFYLKSTALTTQQLGFVPEVFKIAAYGLHKLNLNNKEYSQEYKQNLARVAGVEFNPLSALPMWPVVHALRDSYYGNTPDMNDKMEAKVSDLEKIPDAEARFRVIEADPQLQEHIINRPMKYTSNLLGAMREAQALPLGPVPTKILTMSGALDEYTPHLLPGGKQISNLMRGLGFDHVDPEGMIVPRVKAYNQRAFDADVANEMLRMTMTGEDKPILAKENGTEELHKVADKTIRTKMLKDLFLWSTLGVKISDAPEIDKLWNVVQDSNERPDLMIPSMEESNKIRKETGVDDQHTIDMIWRAGGASVNPQRFLDMKEQVRRDQNFIMNNFPEPNLGLASELAANARWKASAKKVNDSLMMNNSSSYRSIGELLPMDRSLQALAYSFGSQEMTDENGKVTGIKIDFKGDTPNELRDFAWQFLKMTPTDQLEQYKKQDPKNIIIKNLFPKRYQELRLMAPNVDNTYLNSRVLDGQVTQDQHGILLSPDTVESDVKHSRFQSLFETIKKLHPENPLDFPVNATKYFMENNGDKLKSVIDGANSLGKKFGELLAKANPFVLDKAYAYSDESMATAAEIVSKPDTPLKRDTVQSVKQKMNDVILPLLATHRVDDLKKARDEFRFMVSQNPQAGPVAQYLYPYKAGFFNGLDGETNGNPAVNDLKGMAIGGSLNLGYVDWASRTRDMLRNGIIDKEAFKQQIDIGNSEKGAADVSYMDVLRKNNPFTVDEMNWRSQGYRYALGNYTNANFGSDVAARKIYRDLAYYKPGETKPEYDARVSQLVSDPALPQQTLSTFIQHYRDNGQPEVVDAIQKLKMGQYVKVPLDTVAKNQVESTRQFVYDNIDQPGALYQYFKENPTEAELIRQYDPKTYRVAENKFFGPADNSVLNYVKANDYTPESMENMLRHNPNTFNRLFYRNQEFQAAAIQNGLTPPSPVDGTESMVQKWNSQNGQFETVAVPSFAAPPEPLAPDPVPEGTFSSFPNAINYVQRSARKQQTSLLYRNSVAPATLSQSDRDFMTSTPEEQVFKSFPGVVGQAFSEGKLSPNDVISQLHGLADYGFATGALDPQSHNNFTGFLQNSSTVFGATQFGFKLGQFLDDTFRTPRLPISSKVLDFVLAGGPVSGGALTTGKEKLRVVSPIAPALVGSTIPPTIPQGAASSVGADVAAVTGGAGAAASGASAIPAVAAAAPGLPAIGAAFAAISLGFTVANVIRSGGAAKRLASKQRQLENDRNNEILRARAEANAAGEENIQHQLAQQRLSQFEQAQRAREADFAQRTREFLNSGATMPAFASQPKEFQQRFANDFGPELLQFTRRPQFQSRVNLIDSVSSRIPKVRY